MTNEAKLENWEKFIKNELYCNLNLFVEVRMTGNKINTYYQKYYKLKDIEKKELLYLIKNIFDGINTSYIVSTRAVGDSERKYFIVASGNTK